MKLYKDNYYPLIKSKNIGKNTIHIKNYRHLVIYNDRFCYLNIRTQKLLLLKLIKVLTLIKKYKQNILFILPERGDELPFSFFYKMKQQKQHDLIYIDRIQKGIFSNSFFSGYLSKKKRFPDYVFFLNIHYYSESVIRELFNLNIPILALLNAHDDPSGIHYYIYGDIYIQNKYHFLLKILDKYLW